MVYRNKIFELENSTKKKILGIGINLSGRINNSLGYSYSFFNFKEIPLANVIESIIGIRVLLENDSRGMAYGEFYSGMLKEERDVLFLNLDYLLSTANMS